MHCALKWAVSFAPLLLALLGCDPAKILVLKASKKHNGSVAVYFRDSVGFASPSNSSRLIVITVPDSGANQFYKKIFYLGFGNWPDESVRAFAKNTDSIVFVSGRSSRRVLQSKKEIESYLLHQRSGLLENTLTIKAK